MSDLQKTLQCQTCKEDVEFNFHITKTDDGFTNAEDFETTRSACTCRVTWLDWLSVVENKVDGRIFGSQSCDLNYGHTVSRSV